MLGFALIARGSFSEAGEVCEDALTMSREAGDSRAIAIAASNLGHVRAQEGHLRQALVLQGEALRVAHELWDAQGAAEVLLDVAAIAESMHDYEAAGTMVAGIAGLCESNGFALVSVQVGWFGELVDVLRQRLAAEELDRVWARGGQMQFDELVRYAVEFIDSRA